MAEKGLRKISKEDLKAILKKHKLWVGTNFLSYFFSVELIIIMLLNNLFARFKCIVNHIYRMPPNRIQNLFSFVFSVVYPFTK